MVLGSFTGIRIGLSTIKAFCDVNKKPCVSVSSLEALAYTVTQEDCYICSMIDAKHSNIYYSIFEIKNGKYLKVNDFAFSSIDDLLLVLGSLKKKIFFVGNCGILYKDVIRLHVNNEVFFEEDSLPCSKHVGIAAFDKYEQGLIQTSYELSALYLKKSSAEEKFTKKEN